MVANAPSFLLPILVKLVDAWMVAVAISESAPIATKFVVAWMVADCWNNILPNPVKVEFD